MDYRRIIVDYPSSPRVEDALIRLAQLELARGNYDGALEHLNRIATEHPDSPARARAGYWMARAMFDKNDVQGGCAALADALTRTSDNDTELRNQITYLNQRCASDLLASAAANSRYLLRQPQLPVTTTPVTTTSDHDSSCGTDPRCVRGHLSRRSVEPAVSVPAPVKKAPMTSSTGTSDTEKPATGRTGERVFSVQIAAYNVKSQADAMVVKLKKNGYEARVDGTSAPFRVRIGKYATAGAGKRSPAITQGETDNRIRGSGRHPVSRATSTPLMQQYREIKDPHQNAILFFRMGDFYEMFYEDAEIASRALGLTLTSRNNGGASRFRSRECR